MKRDPQLLIDEFGSSHPNALRLAEVVSIAVRVEPELLRMARLTLVPEANAGDEADLWFSPLVQTRNSLGFVFDPKIVSILRKRLKDNIRLLDDIWYKVFIKVHRSISRALFIEELVTWRALRNSNDPKIEKLLLRTLSAIVADDDQNGVSLWVLRALPNLADSTRQSEIAPILKLGARLRLGDKDSFLDIKESATSELLIDLGYKLLPPNLGTDKIGVHFIEAGIEIGDINLLKDAETLELPATSPLLIKILWKEKSGQEQIKSIWINKNEKVLLPVDAYEVELRTLSDRYKLYKSESGCPLYRNNVIVDGATAAGISFTTVMNPDVCNGVVRVIGNIKDFVMDDELQLGPTPVNRLIIRGEVTGRDDTNNSILFHITEMISLPKKHVKHCMKYPPLLVEVNFNIQEVTRFFIRNNAKEALVQDKGKIVGIITYTDIVYTFAQGELNVKAKDIMKKELITIDGDMPLCDVIKLFHKHNIGRLIVTINDIPKGILSKSDVLNNVLFEQSSL